MLKIGPLKLKNWLIMAPMAGFTNLPFRLMVKRLGAGLVTTEMISATGLTRGQKKTFEYLKTQPEEGPLAVQLFGSEPDVMAAATEIAIESGAKVVDINMGCPVKKILKSGAGGALLRAPEKATRVISAVRKTCSVPLTAKIRAGWSPEQSVVFSLVRVLEDCGVDAITVHPRFVTQGFAGKADWTLIAKAKSEVRIPIIGNGDVIDPTSAFEMKNQTGCNGVMIGREAVRSPWIFKQINDIENGIPFRSPSLADRRALIMQHFQLLSYHVGEKRAAVSMRGLLLWYTKGLPNSSRFRRSITRIKDLDTLVGAMDIYFSTLGD